MARFFIDRPVFACVVSLLIILGGLVCIFTLPVAQFPEIVPPTVTVTTTYPGANAEVVAQAVAGPIEQELSGIKNLVYFSSQSGNDGALKITCTFEIGADQDIAAVEVQNRLSRAQPRLPQEVIKQGIIVNKASTQILFMAALQSDNPQYDQIFLSNYATINIMDALKRIPGAGDVVVYGAKDYSMRLWVNPDKISQRGLTVSDVASAVREQNAQYASGRLGAPPNATPPVLTVPAITRGWLETPAEFEDIILKANPDGSMVRVRDVARAELGSQSYDLYSNLNGKPTAIVIFYLQAGANALNTFKACKKTLAELATSFPKGVKYTMPYDTVTFVEVSIHEVLKTFFEAVFLVLLVVFIFLQNWRATLIPLLAVPVSIIGAFAGMMLLGFSINTLTLFGLVLAIGIVVDDAIVVVENVERIMEEEHLPVREATIKAMDEVTGPVIAIVLVLCAVFVPVAFLGGLTGVMYKQFAVTIAISVVISGLVALSLSPALCRLLLKPTHGKKNFFFRGFNAGFDVMTRGYTAMTRVAIRLSLVSLIVFGILLWAMVRMFGLVPSGFVPAEDQGAFIIHLQLPSGASLERTAAVSERVEKWMMKQPEVSDVVTLGGMNVLASSQNSTYASAIYVMLKPWDERKDPSKFIDPIIARVNAQFRGEKDAIIIAFNMPPIIGLGTRVGFEMQLMAKSGQNVRDVAVVMQDFLQKCRERPELDSVSAVLSVQQPQLYLDLNRDKSKSAGVPISDVFQALQAFFGTLYVNDFVKFGRVYRVMVQAEPEFRTKPDDIGKVYIRNTKGALVPLSELVSASFKPGPNFVSRFNAFTAVQITGAPKPGYSTGQANKALLEVAKTTLPEGYATDWSGATFQEVKAGNQAPIVMAFALVVVFLVLAAQYEMWSLPIAVLLTVPLGLLGALVAVYLRGLTSDVYFTVGLLTLVGLAAKNAILILEFCVVLRNQGKTIVESAVEAARMRLRPILMTSLAFILGCVPLAKSTGAGAAGRVSIGTGIIGGMIAATVFAVFLVPVFYVVLSKLTSRDAPRTQPPPEPTPAHEA